MPFSCYCYCRVRRERDNTHLLWIAESTWFWYRFQINQINLLLEKFEKEFCLAVSSPSLTFPQNILFIEKSILYFMVLILFKVVLCFESQNQRLSRFFCHYVGFLPNSEPHFFSLFILLSRMDILANISFREEYPKRNQWDQAPTFKKIKETITKIHLQVDPS